MNSSVTIPEGLFQWGKASWRPLLEYVARLHLSSVHPADDTFDHPWEEIGPGYCYGPAFGHWDIVHQMMDVVEGDRNHARLQLLNNLKHQQPDGLLPGSIWMREGGPQWNANVTHPPVWPVAADAILQKGRDRALLQLVFARLKEQLNWWREHRQLPRGGYFYTDISTKKWESGVDEGIRFLDTQDEADVCVDATAHLFLLLEAGVRWGLELGAEVRDLEQERDALRAIMVEELWCHETGFFHDRWAIQDPSLRCYSHEGIWPVVVGAAREEQAHRVIDENLLNADRFFTTHPLATVARSDHRFEQRMWRGPTWNSITWWAARGCLNYGRDDAAVQLLEAALDQSARVFDETGCIWEFYHSEGGSPLDCTRKPDTPFNTPCRDYLGHNPLLAMARLWEEVV